MASQKALAAAMVCFAATRTTVGGDDAARLILVIGGARGCVRDRRLLRSGCPVSSAPFSRDVAREGSEAADGNGPECGDCDGERKVT